MTKKQARHQGPTAPFPETPIDAKHRQALDDIEARGESPRDILSKFDAMDKQLRARHGLPSALAEGSPSDQSPRAVMARTLADARYFEDTVSAGTPIPNDAPLGQPAQLSDVFGPINLKGKIVARVSGWSMRDSSIKDGDLVLVDPKAEIKDGDIVLAHVAGHGQVVKRLRLPLGENAILESANPDFKPIVISEPSDLRIHGKVLWRAGGI